MDIWFKTLLLFVVFNKVHLYRQLMNTTCLELAKPSNKHLRLSCNDTSMYHCLLNGNSTNEFEICKKWKWIPEGNCAYLNEYGRNIDARRCLSSAELACPKTLYRSEETIKYAACYVKKNTNSKARQVRNTTCLELARPSNQQFRLSCNNIGTYHCLLDQNYTNEFEICKMWKWIPKGKCAYYSMYSGDNIDERNCTSSSHFVCPEQKYRSENTTNYSACYKRNNPTTVQPQTSLSPVSSNWTSSDGNGGNASSFRTSENAEKHIEIKSVIFFLYIIVIAVVLFISAIFYIQRYMGKGLYMEGKFLDCFEDLLNNYDTGNDNTAKKQADDQVEAGNEIESDKDSRVLFDFASESLKKELPPTGQSNPNEKGKGESGRNCNDIKEKESPTGQMEGTVKLKNKMENGEKSTDALFDAHRNLKIFQPPTDETDLNDDKEKPAGSISGSYHDLQQLDNEEDKEESTDIFDDTFERLQQIPQEIVTLNEDDDEQLSHDSSSAVATTNEAGKTVTE
eukprot:XP_019921412.1 PREDICTED: uncharacterized protein LOC105325036 isoform X5 [Crassostrea gigas]